MSNRGPAATGGVGVDILANGDAGTGLEALSYRLDGWMASSRWRGTSRSVPVASAALALVYDAAFQTNPGVWLTAKEAQAILMAGATDADNDPLAQGAGVVDALGATNIAGGINDGFGVMPASWVTGDYNGTNYPAFAHTCYPETTTANPSPFSNPTSNPITINLASDQLIKTGELIIPFNSESISLESSIDNRPDYIFDIGGQIPAGTDLLQVDLIFPFDQFDSNLNYAQEQRWWLKVINWTDINGDDNLWTDDNSNNVVNDGEIDDWEYLRFAYDYATNNTQVVRVRQPFAQMTDGIFVALNHVQRTNLTPTTSLQIRLSFYEHSAWSWLGLSDGGVVLPANSSKNFTATLNIPPNTPFGSYDGAIVAESTGGGQKSVIPIIAHVMANSLPATFGHTPPANLAYDNGHVTGQTNWSYREEAGDWRYFFLDVPASGGDNSALLVHDIWDDGFPTDIDTKVFAPESDSFSQNDPAYYGTYTLTEAASSENSHISRGKYAFETATGGSEEWLGLPMEAGLHLLAQHNVLYAGNSFSVPFTLTVGSMEALPANINISSCQISGTLPISISTDIPVAGLNSTGYGLNQAQTVSGTINQDGVDPATASFTHTLTITNGGRIEIDVTAIGAGIVEVDVYLLYDF